MTNKQILMATTAILSCAFFAESVRAENIVDTGSCGTTCEWTINDDGVLTVRGTGENGSGEFEDRNWDNTVWGSVSSSVKQSVKSVVVAEGITKIGSHSFTSFANLEEVSLPDTLRTIGSYALGKVGIKLSSLKIPTSVTSIGQCGLTNCLSNVSLVVIMDSSNANKIHFDWGALYKQSEVICKECSFTQAQNLSTKLTYSMVNVLETQQNGNTVKKDMYGNFIEAWNSGKTEKYDANGNVVAQYDSKGTLLYRYTYDDGITSKYDANGRLLYAKGADGSDYYYDSQGNLTGMKKRGPFTIPEANALTKDGPVNTVTFTW